VKTGSNKVTETNKVHKKVKGHTTIITPQLPRAKSSSLNPLKKTHPHEQAGDNLNPLISVSPQSSSHGHHHDPISTSSINVRKTIRLDGKLQDPPALLSA